MGVVLYGVSFRAMKNVSEYISSYRPFDGLLLARMQYSKLAVPIYLWRIQICTSRE
jgi:hypothetical protein